MDLNLGGKVVVVTGGAAGIGWATADAFAREGSHVVTWDVTGDPRVDVTDAIAVRRAADAAIANHGRIDILINNAGIVRDAQLVKWKDGMVTSQMDDVTFDAVLDVNLRGVFLCTRTVVPHMIASGGGVILNASSIVGLYGNFGQTNYAAAKAGVISFTKTCREVCPWSRRLDRRGFGPRHLMSVCPRTGEADSSRDVDRATIAAAKPGRS